MQIIIGIDPDSDRHGVAVYIDGELQSLHMLNTPEIIIDYLPRWQEFGNVQFSIEDVMANKFVYGRNRKATKAAESKVAMNIGHVQQAQKELMTWLNRYLIRYHLHKPQKGNWAENKDQFQKITGWTKSSNADTRAAAYFGFLSTKVQS